jgi:hypothetical protein
MLTRLIDTTPADHRRGANQMRQQLSIGEHFWRGNAPSHPDCRATDRAGDQGDDKKGVHDGTLRHCISGYHAGEPGAGPYIKSPAM